MTAIIDYGLGNLGSIQNMLRRLNVECIITKKPSEILVAERLILPGVGAFDEGMKNLENLGLIDVLTTAVISQKVPILGICLGFQLLMKRSDEGKTPGLGWIEGETVCLKKIAHLETLRVPHMGWNEVAIKQESKLFDGFLPRPRFYFVHSYGVSCTLNGENTIGISNYDAAEFVSAAGKDQIMGVQFHPEKSHKFGMALLNNFVAHYHR